MLEPLDGTLFGPGQPCFGCGPDHPIGFHLRFTRDGDAVVARFTPGTQYQGPPGIMHGGLVTTLADEAAAWAVLASSEKFGFTASLDSRFKKPVRVGVELVARAWVVKASSRVMTVAVEISQKEELCFSAELKFALLDQRGAEALLQGPLPASWQRFCR